MSRVAITCTLLVCVVLTVAGCKDRTTPELVPAATPTSLAVVVLTTDRPTGKISQPRLPGASAVRLDIQTVKNPSGQGLVIELAVENATASVRRVGIGNISLYPSNQGGVFTLVLPGPAEDMVHQEPTVLIVTLREALSGTVLQPGISLSLTAELTLLPGVN